MVDLTGGGTLVPGGKMKDFTGSKTKIDAPGEYVLEIMEVKECPAEDYVDVLLRDTASNKELKHRFYLHEKDGNTPNRMLWKFNMLYTAVGLKNPEDAFLQDMVGKVFRGEIMRGTKWLYLNKSWPVEGE